MLPRGPWKDARAPGYGYQLSAEEHAPLDLVRNARRAEEEGFSFALVSDHFHPWLDQQGHSAFVWSVVGAIAATTERLELGTGVTCPLIRIHPAIVAHAAATAATMMPGRFFLAVGTGENLNEHVLGDGWPAPDDRLDMLEEAVELMPAPAPAKPAPPLSGRLRRAYGSCGRSGRAATRPSAATTTSPSGRASTTSRTSLPA